MKQALDHLRGELLADERLHLKQLEEERIAWTAEQNRRFRVCLYVFPSLFTHTGEFVG